MSTICVFDHIENKHTWHPEKNCMKKFCTYLIERSKHIIDFGKKKMLSLTKEELKSHQDAKVSYIWGKRILKMFAKDKNYRKVRYHCHYTGKYRGAAHSNCNLKFNVSNEISSIILPFFVFATFWFLLSVFVLRFKQ